VQLVGSTGAALTERTIHPSGPSPGALAVFKREPSGEAQFFQRRGLQARVPTDHEQMLHPGVVLLQRLSTLECAEYDVSPDGQRFTMTKGIGRFQTPDTTINIVVNWTEELKRRVPRVDPQLARLANASTLLRAASARVIGPAMEPRGLLRGRRTRVSCCDRSVAPGHLSEPTAGGYRRGWNRGALRAVPSARTAPTLVRTTRVNLSKSSRSTVSSGS